jgi:hypothetical protein
MNWADRTVIYLLLGAALGLAITANVKIKRLDDETHRHLWLQAGINDWRWSIVRNPARLDSLRATERVNP